MGGQAYSNTRAQVVGEDGPIEVRTPAGHKVTARAAIIATNTPITSRFAIPLKQAPYVTYVIGARIPPGSVAKGLYWDTADPYHYVRLQQGARINGESAAHDILIVGGEDHRTGQELDGDDRFARLESWALDRFPMMQSVDYRWSGQIMETMERLGYIGRQGGKGSNVYIATGDSGECGSGAGTVLRALRPCIRRRPSTSCR